MTKLLRYSIFAFLIIGLIVRAVGLQDTSFYDWDEGIYAEVSSELVETGSIQTTFNGEVWFNKPPLSHYMISAMFRTGIDPELGARLVMVVFGSLMLVMTYLVARKLNKHFLKKQLDDMHPVEAELTHMLPVFIVASAPIFLERSTQLNTDVMLGVFWLGYFLYFQSYWMKLLFVTLGTWSKSLLGLYPLGFEVLRLRKESFTPKGFARGAMFLLIPLSWHIVNYMGYGDFFIKSHLMDQLVKRVTDPIELHYGGKLFYVELAWANFSFFFVLFLVAYAWIAFDALMKHKTPMKIWKSKDWDFYLIIFSAVPFFVFLSLVQSKITWYFATVLPLFTLSLPYLYAKIPWKNARYLAVAGIAAYMLYAFIPATYAFKPVDDNRSDLVKMGQCVADLPHDGISVLVNAQERQNRNVLEAAQQQTETSFIYGGSPSFVYYTGKDVTYHYRPEEFGDELNAVTLIAFSADDRQNEEYTDIFASVESLEFTSVDECFVGEWEVYEIK